MTATRQHESIASHPNPVQTVRWSPDGHTLLTGDTERKLRVWRDGALQYELDLKSAHPKFHTAERIRCVDFAPDGSVAYVCCGDSIRAIRLETGTTLWACRTPRFLGFLSILALQAVVAPDGRIATSVDNGTFGIRNPQGQRLKIWKDNAAPRWMAFVRGGAELVGSDGFSLRLWDAETGRQTFRWPLDERIYALAKSPTGDVFAVRTLSQILIFEVDQESPVAAIGAEVGLPLLAFANYQPWLAVGDEHHVRIVGFEGRVLQTEDVADAAVLSVGFHPDGRGLYVGCSDGSVRLVPVMLS